MAAPPESYFIPELIQREEIFFHLFLYLEECGLAVKSKLRTL